MSGSFDPRVSHAAPASPTPTALPTRLADPCGWCVGAGKYLEALDCGVEHVYLPVVCAGCGGTGRRTASANAA